MLVIPVYRSEFLEGPPGAAFPMIFGLFSPALSCGSSILGVIRPAPEKMRRKLK